MMQLQVKTSLPYRIAFKKFELHCYIKLIKNSLWGHKLMKTQPLTNSCANFGQTNYERTVARTNNSKFALKILPGAAHTFWQ